MPQGVREKYIGGLKIEVLSNINQYLLLKTLNWYTSIYFLFCFGVRNHEKVVNRCPNELMI